MRKVLAVISLLMLLVSCTRLPYAGGRETKEKPEKLTNVKKTNKTTQINKQSQKRKTELRNDLKTKNNLQKGQEQTKTEKTQQRVKQIRQ